MKTMTKTMLLATALLAGGCTSVEFKALGTESLRNSDGHVIGQKEVLCDCATGEELARISLYLPRMLNGVVVGDRKSVV